MRKCKEIIMGVIKRLLEDNTEEEVKEILRHARTIAKKQAKKSGKSEKNVCITSLESGNFSKEKGA
tara:strand:- start:3405 stop:3602 length:198 start_codon:yes stop_codon:yes gene_type:complete